jgi:hypothetical protein
MGQIRFWQDRAAVAERQYLQACETLARTRKVLAGLPTAVQVNIGGQQVNVVR